MKNTSNKKEEAGALPDDLLEDLARLKGRAAPQKAEPVAPSVLYPVSAAIAERERKKEEARRKAIEEAHKTAKPGQEIPGHGIFLGVWKPKDNDGKSLKKKFNVFAAPQDLQDAGSRSHLTYNETVQLLARTKKFHGYDGAAYNNDTEIYQALREGSYSGEWIIPPFELLVGEVADKPYGYERNKITQPDNLFDHRETGSFKNTFQMTASSGRHNYFSSTEFGGYICEMWFQVVGQKGYTRKDIGAASCRPVRLEPVP
jgi:hypothetical protein